MLHKKIEVNIIIPILKICSIKSINFKRVHFGHFCKNNTETLTCFSKENFFVLISATKRTNTHYIHEFKRFVWITPIDILFCIRNLLNNR